jgi:hypothetical protein
VLESRNDDRSQPRKYVADSAAFERKGCAFERSTALLVWNKGVCSHAEARQVSAGTRLCWNRPMCVRLQELRLTALSTPEIPGTLTEIKQTGNKENTNLFFFFF